MSEWKKVKLGDVSLCIQPGPFGTQLHNSDYTDKGVPVIMPKDMIDGRVLHDKLEHVSEDTANRISRHKVDAGDIMVARKGDVRKCIYIRESEEGWITGSDCLKMQLNQKICNSKFIYFQLRSPYIGAWLQQVSKGATMPSLNTSLLSNIEIVLPPISTQNNVAEILSRYDSLIENYQKQIKLLEEAAQRLYKEWFVDLHFPGHENTKIVDGVPEGWEKKRLSDISNIIMGQSPKSEFYNTDGNGLPFHQGVGSYGYRFVVDNTYSTSFTRIAEPNSILFSVRAPVGRLNITKNKIVIGRGLASINHKMGCQSYLYYLLKEKFFKDNIIGNGAIFASISKDELYNLAFIMPSDEMIKRYDAIANKLDKDIQYVDSQIRLLTEARDRLLPKLMSGEITV